MSYAPEFESVEETKEKLMDRKRIIERKITSMYEFLCMYLQFIPCVKLHYEGPKVAPLY